MEYFASNCIDWYVYTGIVIFVTDSSIKVLVHQNENEFKEGRLSCENFCRFNEELDSKVLYHEIFQINLDCGTCITRQEDGLYSNKTSGICYKLNKTACTNKFLGTITVETTFVNVGCPTNAAGNYCSFLNQ